MPWSSLTQDCYSGAANGANNTRLSSTTSTVSSSSSVPITTSPTSSYQYFTTPVNVVNTASRAPLLHSSASQLFSTLPTKQTSSTDNQSHFTVTSSVTTLTVSSQLHPNIQTSSVPVVSTSVTSLSLNNAASSVSSGTSTGPYRSSNVTGLQVVALVLSGLVILVALMIVVLTVRYCNYGNSLQPHNLRKKLFPMNGHHGFTQLQTFDPDVSDDELTIFNIF